MRKLKLYSYWRSSCSYRVRIALELKALKYEYIPVHLVSEGGHQHQHAYKALNPMSQVPTLIHGNSTLTQSLAIIDYLDREFPSPPLFPTNNEERAKVLQICEDINSGIQPLQNLHVLKYLKRESGLDSKAVESWSRYWIKKGFEAIEAKLERYSKTYCIGQDVTAADLFLIPQVYNGLRFGVDLKPFPCIARVNETCLELPAFQAAEPSRQPDTQ